MPTSSPTLLLFDVDGTLALTGGAGLRAMTTTFAELTGVADAFHGIPVAGRLDPRIVDDAVARAGLSWSPSDHERFRRRYGVALREEMRRPNPASRAMPGVKGLVETLAADPAMFVALLTGNYPEGARVKLEHFDLWRHFRCGAFGDDAADREGLVPVAVERARALGLPALRPDRVVVIGDTPLDVACAKANGARAVAVATGPYPVERLAETGADAVLPDLSDESAFRRAIGD